MPHTGCHMFECMRMPLNVCRNVVTHNENKNKQLESGKNSDTLKTGIVLRWLSNTKNGCQCDVPNGRNSFFICRMEYFDLLFFISFIIERIKQIVLSKYLGVSFIFQNK